MKRRKIDDLVAAKLVELAQKGAAMGVDHGRMCDSCAFRKGSDTNSSEAHNTAKALDCLANFGHFRCHSHDADGKLIDAGKSCAGYLYAKQYLDSKERLAE